MNLFDIFEGRMQQIFERGNTMAPFPFKKLAKTAVREMKSCSAKLDGRQVAPTLYTILVSPSDDALIGPLYQQVTDELVDFLAHEAQNAGLALTANPTVRFIPVGTLSEVLKHALVRPGRTPARAVRGVPQATSLIANDKPAEGHKEPAAVM